MNNFMLPSDTPSPSKKPSLEPTCNELGQNEVNQVFLEIMRVIRQKQNPNDEIFHTEFVYHDSALNPLFYLLEELRDFQENPSEYKETKAWFLPHSHSSEELEAMLGSQYIQILNNIQYYFGEIKKSGVFIPMIDSSKQTIESHIAIGSYKINPWPQDREAEFFQDFNEKEKLQMILSHEIAHFIQFCLALKDKKTADDYQFNQIDFHQSTYSVGITEFLEAFFSTDLMSSTEEFDKVDLHTQFQKMLFTAAKEIYADSFAILLSTQLNDFSMPLNEVFHSFLSSRQKLAQPVFLEQALLREAQAEPKTIEKERQNFDMLLGDTAHQTEFGLTHLMRHINAHNIEAKQLNVEQIDKLCQDAMVYGLTQLIYEASLTYPEYGQYIAQIQSTPSQQSLLDDKSTHTITDLFGIVSQEDKEKTQKRVFDYQANKNAQVVLDIEEQIELYQQVVVKTEFVGPSSSILLSLGKVSQQETLFDKIKAQRENYVIEKLNGDNNLEVPKPISLKR